MSQSKYVSVLDIKCARFHAPATRQVYVQLPSEDYTDGTRGRLNMSMNGTRGAASNWEAKHTAVMLD
eukprot:12084800-Karenia_brevis.AAC.1